MGTDLRPDGVTLGIGDSLLVSAQRSYFPAGKRAGALLRRCQLGGNQMGHTTGRADRYCFRSAGISLGFVPIITGHVDWHQATTFTLTIPFAGKFGQLTSLMAGLYLIGFAAPAFEAAACHVGEAIDPEKSVPRAMFASGAMAGLYFIVLPVVWLGTIGPEAMGPTWRRSWGRRLRHCWAVLRRARPSGS